MSPNHSRPKRSRRSRAGPSQDDSLPRQRPVQKAVQYISAEHFPMWAERWTLAPPRRKSDKTSSNTRPPVVSFEHEFKLNFPPAPLTPDDDAPSTVDSHSGRPTKKNTRRTRKRAPYPASSLQQPQSTSTQASAEEPGLNTPTFESFSTSLQAEFVATSPGLSGGSITPDVVFYPVSRVDDSRNLSFPMYNHYQHEVSAGSLAQCGYQILPNGANTLYHSQVPSFPDPTLRWTPGDGGSYFPSAPPSYYHHNPDGNQSYVDAMDRGTCLNHSSSDLRLPHLSEPYTQPRGQLHQKPARDIDAPDKHILFPYNTQS